MTRPVALALSPHLDDAAFSCGGTLARLSARGWRVVVATLFTDSVPNPTGFALACQLDKGLAPTIDYMALRRAEDEEACRELGARPVWLPFREAPHRGYGSAPELFGEVRADDVIRPLLMDAIAALLGEHRPDLILAPQAIGGHVDHVQVVGAIDARPPEQPILWWRDFPYAARRAGRDPFHQRFARLPDVAVDCDGTSKRAAVLAYRSQLGFQFGGPDGWDRLVGETGTRERFRLGGALSRDLAGIVASDQDAHMPDGRRSPHEVGA